MSQILIAEDSKFQRKKIVSLVEGLGYQVTQAENGLEAFEHLEKSKFDLVITDLLMPKVDGVELLRKIKEANIQVNSIVLTADIQAPIKTECLALGAKAFLNKPLNDEELISAIKKHIA